MPSASGDVSVRWMRARRLLEPVCRLRCVRVPRREKNAKPKLVQTLVSRAAMVAVVSGKRAMASAFHPPTPKSGSQLHVPPGRISFVTSGCATGEEASDVARSSSLRIGPSALCRLAHS